MPFAKEIRGILKELTSHEEVVITPRGNIAIASALCAVEGLVLIPEEAGWLSYKKIPLKLGLELMQVKCNDGKIDLRDLEEKAKGASAFLYQNPGGYFAQEPMEEIYNVCKQNNCVVIMDVSGAIGTDLCDGRYADIIVGSFGRWKLVEAGVGGFISSSVFDLHKIEALTKTSDLKNILSALKKLTERIVFLELRREHIIKDLANFDILHPADVGFVVVIKYDTVEERRDIVAYCEKQNLEYTQCPRYIRVNDQAISIEVKRLT